MTNLATCELLFAVIEFGLRVVSPSLLLSLSLCFFSSCPPSSLYLPLPPPHPPPRPSCLLVDVNVSVETETKITFQERCNIRIFVCCESLNAADQTKQSPRLEYEVTVHCG